MIFRVGNEIAKAHTNSEDLVLLEVGTSDPSEPLKPIWRPLLVQTARDQAASAAAWLWGSGRVPRKGAGVREA